MANTDGCWRYDLDLWPRFWPKIWSVNYGCGAMGHVRVIYGLSWSFLLFDYRQAQERQTCKRRTMTLWSVTWSPRGPHVRYVFEFATATAVPSPCVCVCVCVCVIAATIIRQPAVDCWQFFDLTTDRKSLFVSDELSDDQRRNANFESFC